MEKVKENAWNDFLEIVKNSWTFKKMAKEEKERWNNTIENIRIINNLKGNYKQRIEFLNCIYFAYLDGLGYSGFDWREQTKEAETKPLLIYKKDVIKKWD